MPRRSARHIEIPTFLRRSKRLSELREKELGGLNTSKTKQPPGKKPAPRYQTDQLGSGLYTVNNIQREKEVRCAKRIRLDLIQNMGCDNKSWQPRTDLSAKCIEEWTHTKEQPATFRADKDKLKPTRVKGSAADAELLAGLRVQK